MKDEPKKKKSKLPKIILAVVAVIIIAIIGVALRYMSAFNGFLDKITNRKPEMKQYSVIVMNDSGLNEVGDLKNKNASFLRTDVKANNAKQYLQDQVEVGVNFYDDMSMMVDMLKNRVTDTIVLETDRMEALKEESEDFANSTKVIYTFEIELESESIEVPEKEITEEPFIVYISGSDSRTGIKTTARSDVNIVVVVNPKQSKILLASIPRDTYVQLHDTVGLKDKLTHAGIYGINMSKTTIEDFLGISIDYTIKVSFETVVKVVDELDGIDIESDKEMSLKAEGKDKRCNYVVGVQHVDGDCALRFARERKSYKTGDIHRGENQQQVITSIIGRLSKSKDYLLKIPTILDIAGDSFETTIPRDNILAFIRMQLTDSIDWKVESVGVSGEGVLEPTYSMGNNTPLYVMLPDEESVQNVKNKIVEYMIGEEIKEEEEQEASDF